MNWMDGSLMYGLELVAKYLPFLISSMAPKTSTFFGLKTCLGKRYWLSRPPPLRDNVPHGLFSAHSAKTCFICTQPQNAFFLAKLALKGNRANGKKSLPGRVPGPKKRNQNGSKIWAVSKRILLLSGPKKVPKIGPGPALP